MNRLRTSLCLIVLGLAAGFLPSATPAVAAEDPASNIPGVAWPGSSVASRVGGAIYDRVWRLTLNEPRLVVISLSGASGSQLGLYVFDSGATSVTSGMPIAVAAKPGGSQSLSLPLQAGTYYVDVNGRNPDRAYTFNLSIVTIPDRSPPFVTLTISDGRGLISDPDSTITVDARDSLSGVARVRVRIDDGAWGEWIAYSSTLPISFDPVEGRHSVEVEAENGLGLVSDTARETVDLDLTAPAAELLAPTSTEVSAPRPLFRIRFNETMNTRSVVGGGVTLVDLAGARVPVSSVYDSTTRTLRLTPTVNLKAGTTYLFQVDTATDVAGNRVQLEESREIRYVATTRFANMSAAPTVRFGSSAQLRADLIGVRDGESVLVESLNSTLEPPTWETIGVTTVSGGAVRASVAPSVTARYRFHYLGDAGHRASASTFVTIGVRPELTLNGTGQMRSTSRASTYRISGQVQPGELTVTLIRYRCTASYSTCTRDGSVQVEPTDDGVVEYLWSTPGSSGAWRWVMRVATSERYAFSQSLPLRVRVR